MTLTSPTKKTSDDTKSGTSRRGLAGTASSLRNKASRGVKSLRKLTVDWLDRPMTSLHLVLAIFALLLGFGLLMVLSSSAVSAFRAGGSSFSVFANQATYAAIGLVCFCAAQFLPVRLMRSTSTIAVIVSLVLLVAVITPLGAKVNGARSWIRIAGFQFQPSEIAKLALLLWMAHVLAARRHTLGSPKALLIPVLPVFVLMSALIMYQPDLGTTVALTIVFMAVLFFAGAPWWIFAGLGTIGAGAFFALAFSADYRMARLLSFIDPEAHPDVSYQLLQSLYGMGNGGWFGVGLGQSRAKWSYLPNADSDFIFAIIGEELGLIGAGILLLLFALLAYTGLRIARRNVDPFVKIVASAATVWLVGQAGINIGYVVGLLPVTGIPLPMISSGGTSLLITMVVFGLLANFARREPQAAAALQAGGGGRLARFLGMQHGEMTGKRASLPRRRRPSGTGDTRAASGPSRTSSREAMKKATVSPAPRRRRAENGARQQEPATRRGQSAARPPQPVSRQQQPTSRRQQPATREQQTSTRQQQTSSRQQQPAARRPQPRPTTQSGRPVRATPTAAPDSRKGWLRRRDGA